MQTVHLKSGKVIPNVTRIAKAPDNLLNVHTPGSGYFPVAPESIEKVEPA